jgi:hypothetical protein
MLRWQWQWVKACCLLVSLFIHMAMIRCKSVCLLVVLSHVILSWIYFICFQVVSVFVVVFEYPMCTEISITCLMPYCFALNLNELSLSLSPPWWIKFFSCLITKFQIVSSIILSSCSVLWCMLSFFNLFVQEWNVHIFHHCWNSFLPLSPGQRSFTYKYKMRSCQILKISLMFVGTHCFFSFLLMS